MNRLPPSPCRQPLPKSASTPQRLICLALLLAPLQAATQGVPILPPAPPAPAPVAQETEAQKRARLAREAEAARAQRELAREAKARSESEAQLERERKARAEAEAQLASERKARAETAAQLERERKARAEAMAAATAASAAAAAAPAIQPETMWQIEAYPGGPKLMALPTGRTFRMGSRANEAGHEPDEAPPHDVVVRHRFAMGLTEVTRGQFAAFVSATGHQTDAERNANGQAGCYAWSAADGKRDWRAAHHWKAPGFEQTDSHPVVCVSWNDVQAYLAWLNKHANISPGSTHRYRLPTEAEWEYAARAGTTTRYPWGDDPRNEQQCAFANGADQTLGPGNMSWIKKANCSDAYFFTAPVGRFADSAKAKGHPHPFGLSDMHGNVWEWVQDCYDDKEYARRQAREGGWPADQASTEKADCRRVFRGGSWNFDPQQLRSAFRNDVAPGIRRSDSGFRLARTLP